MIMTTTVSKSKRRMLLASKRFKTRTERVEWYEKQFGWKPLTDEDRAALDDAVRMVTNFN